MGAVEFIVLVALVAAAFVQRSQTKRLRADADQLVDRVRTLEHDVERIPGLQTRLVVLELQLRGGAEPAPAPPAVPDAAAPSARLDAESAMGGEDPAFADEAGGDTDPAEEPGAGPQSPATSRPPVVAPAPPRPVDWERFVTQRLSVWVGAAALAIAGFFFVSYVIESDVFGPEARVVSAAAASLTFLAGAELVRRRVKTGNAGAIAAALGAAAVATAYATVYLATLTYGFLPVGAGLIATIGVSLAAVAIALAYGEFIAFVGIAGGYIAPVVYGGGEPNADFLTAYLLAVTAVSFALIRYRNWWRLSVLALAGPGLWMVLFGLMLGNEPLWGSVLLIGLVAIAVLASWRGWREDGSILSLTGLVDPSTPQRRALAAAVIISAAAFVWYLVNAQYGLSHWWGLTTFAGGAAALGAWSAPHRALQLPILVAATIATLLGSPTEPADAYVVLAVLPVVLTAGALVQLNLLREPALWAGVVAFVPVFWFAVALFRVAGWVDVTVDPHGWAIGALALAAAYVALIGMMSGRIDERLRGSVFAALGASVMTLLSLGIALELDPLYFPAAAAFSILGLAALHMRLREPVLRLVAGAYLCLYLVLVLGALAYSNYSAAFFTYVFAPAGAQDALILLTLPGIALLAGATLFQRSGVRPRRPLVLSLDWAGLAAIALGLLYALTPSGTPLGSQTLVTVALTASPELILAAVAVYLGRRLGRPGLQAGGIALTVIACLGLLLGAVAPLLLFWPPFAVPGSFILNVSLAAYGLPGLLLLVIGRGLGTSIEAAQNFGRALSVFAVALLFAMVLVQVRQAWHVGEATIAGDTSQPEFYAYSLATLAFGFALLAVGMVFRDRAARVLSSVFVLGATVKVFLFDASSLEGLWRVLSFLLMGLSLLGISWAYARFVFGVGLRRPPGAGPDVPEPSPQPA